ncbi:MAG TPA: cbb3-type cytochrome oxidase assembly protein CcoS [Oceanospirillaceae bacterium]|nr:cbb3-type cytochrome oxidase assembly protein CcoS [Oceanospirillaceae bacterium]
MSATAAPDCYHCGESVPSDSNYQIVLDQSQHKVCCIGCQTVANTIIDQGLADYYRHRELSRGANPNLPANINIAVSDSAHWLAYDDNDVQSAFVRQKGAQEKETELVIDGLTCAACVWLLNQHISKLPGILHFNVNLTTQRAYVHWQTTEIQLSSIMAAIDAIGYQPGPYQASDAAKRKALDKRQMILRLGIAGLGAMQVMMLSFGMYAGLTQGMELSYVHFMRWSALVLTTPVVLYSAMPFFKAAIRALKNRHLVMDVPVSIAIGAAYIASVWATVMQTGDVYYDSVTMFTFLLLLGRFVESTARYHAGHAGNELHQLLPPVCDRMVDGKTQQIAVTKLASGDLIRVLPGATIPADGILHQGSSSINEAALTGEFMPVEKHLGDALTAGTVNVSSSLVMQVTKTQDDSRLQQILSMVKQAHSFRPQLSKSADQVAHYFVLAVLLISACVYTGWYFIDPSKAFWITLSVLVITCPCALSLAAPTATAVATASLRRQGILMTREDSLEEIAKVDTVVFDKTGTLTTGVMTLHSTVALGDISVPQCKLLAACLEQQSEHPISRAFRHLDASGLQLQDITNHPSQGLSASWPAQQTQVRIGKPEFVQALGQWPMPERPAGEGVWLLLGNAQQALAWFHISDAKRPELHKVMPQLKDLGMHLCILSGDHPNNVAELAQDLAMDDWRAAQTPAQKLAFIQSLQQQGKTVLMVGDGINDAPVMAAANASLAMASGTDLSKASAPALLLRDHLGLISVLIKKARHTRRIMLQNLAWALLYNLIALPLAAMGLVPPWGAATGMSFSSLLVVLNATRLRRIKHDVQ